MTPHRKSVNPTLEVPFDHLRSRKFCQWPNYAPHLIVEATIIVAVFTAPSHLFLKLSYELVCMNVRLNVPEFPLHINPNNSSPNRIALFQH